MKLTILGSGTCVPSLKRSSCSVLLEAGKSLLLFDLGAGTIKRLLEAGKTIQDLDYIFFSHLHPDHTGEFVSFLFSTKYPEHYSRRRPFTVAAAKGFSRFYKNLQKAYGDWIVMKPGLMNIQEMDNKNPDERDYGDFTLKTRPMDHSPQSIGYRITAGGKSFVYSGDTDACPDLVDLARGADLLVCESALPDDLKVSGHMTPSEAGLTAQKAGVRRLVLTHFYPECDEVDIRAQCRKNWQGPLDLAADLMEIEI